MPVAWVCARTGEGEMADGWVKICVRRTEARAGRKNYVRQATWPFTGHAGYNTAASSRPHRWQTATVAEAVKSGDLQHVIFNSREQFDKFQNNAGMRK